MVICYGFLRVCLRYLGQWGTTNDSLSKFVPDGETIQWRVKDTTNGGDFDGQEWEEVTASATVDCGCAGGSVDIDITSQHVETALLHQS